MDVDGVLTDGKLINVPDAAGNMVETKAFDSQDGIALQWLSWKGIKTGLISGRVSPATDVVVMHRVGLAVATANARYEVKQEAHYVTHSVGGSGAVREVVELILKAQGCWEEILQKYEISSTPGHRIG